jgi:uncharacterized DUF497 family protein
MTALRLSTLNLSMTNYPAVQQNRNGVVRVYGARDMTDREKRKYRKGN